MRIRNRKSFVTAAPERQPPRSPGSKITQGLYVLLLAAIVAYVAHYLFQRFWHFEAPGQVEVAYNLITPTRSGRLQLDVRVGQAVQAGQPLAVVQPPQVCNESTERAERLKTDLSVLDTRLRVHRAQLAKLEERLARYDRGRVFELDRGTQRERNDLAQTVDTLRGELDVLASERAALQRELARLEAPRPPDPACAPELIHAPYAGTVQRVFAEPLAVLRAGDPILALAPEEPDVRVLAYMNPDDMRDLEVGSEVEVVLPDDTVTPGRLSAVGSSALPFADRKWEGYRPQAPELLLDVRPTGPEVATRWRTLDRIPVMVRGKR